MIGDTDGDGEYDDAIYFALTSRPNFYDVDTTYNLDDIDGDGVANDDDATPFDPQASLDTDGDGVADPYDAFPDDANETTDLDGDGIGDNTDDDIDGDGVLTKTMRSRLMPRSRQIAITTG